MGLCGIVRVQAPRMAFVGKRLIWEGYLLFDTCQCVSVGGRLPCANRNVLPCPSTAFRWMHAATAHGMPMQQPGHQRNRALRSYRPSARLWIHVLLDKEVERLAIGRFVWIFPSSVPCTDGVHFWVPSSFGRSRFALEWVFGRVHWVVQHSSVGLVRAGKDYHGV